jgi:hypothetical protein
MKVWIIVDRYYTTKEEAVAECNALNEQGYSVTIEVNEIDHNQNKWAGQERLAEQRNRLIDFRG